MSVNKTSIAATIAAQTGLSKNRASNAVTAIIEAIASSLASGEEVKIAGFGKFYPQALKARRGRHPKTGRSLDIADRKTVRLTCYKHLREKINAPGRKAVGGAPKPSPQPERRHEPRMEDLPRGKAVVRISGIPVCEFDIKDISGNGTSILMEEDSVVLRNIRVGQDIELHMAYASSNKSVLQRSRIAHITHQSDDDAYPGHVMVGVKVIDTLAIQ